LDENLGADFVCLKNFGGGSTFHGLRTNIVAVVILKYEQVVIACTGWHDEATGLIGEDLALFSVLHYGGKAMKGARAGIFTLWEKIEVGVDSDRVWPADGQTVVTTRS